MGIYRNQVLPRVIHRILDDHTTRRVRREALASARGTVLELGFGSGPNIPELPVGVDRLIAVDPAAVGRQLAQERIAAASFPIEFAELIGTAIEVEDATADVAITTWTLCTIPDVSAALAEVRRILKPGGTLLFAEHGAHPDERVNRLQRRVEPVWKRLAGGCHLTRDPFVDIADAGFELLATSSPLVAGPKFANHMYQGIARPLR